MDSLNLENIDNLCDLKMIYEVSLTIKRLLDSLLQKLI